MCNIVFSNHKQLDYSTACSGEQHQQKLHIIVPLWGESDGFPYKVPVKLQLVRKGFPCHDVFVDAVRYPGLRLNIKTVFARYGITMLKIRRSRDRLIFNMGIPILVRRHLYIDPPGSEKDYFSMPVYMRRDMLTWKSLSSEYTRTDLYLSAKTPIRTNINSLVSLYWSPGVTRHTDLWMIRLRGLQGRPLLASSTSVNFRISSASRTR